MFLIYQILTNYGATQWNVNSCWGDDSRYLVLSRIFSLIKKAILLLLPDTARLVDERNTNLNAKRQDVDHVFLRFGRRFGM